MVRSATGSLARGFRRLAGKRKPTVAAGATRLDLRIVVPNDAAGFSRALFQSVGVALSPGHQLDVFDNGTVFDALHAAIAGARVSVNLVLFIWDPGALSERLVAALCARARAGVRCRLLVDTVGSPRFEAEIAPALAAAGCEVRMFRPAILGTGLQRNHRKIVVVDGRVAFTGGFGLRDCWMGDGCSEECWRDVSVRFVGPAVASAQQAFAENWQEAGGELLPEADFPELPPAGPSFAAFMGSTASPNVTRAERAMLLVMAAATRRLWLRNAYFVPTEAIRALLARKARAGCDVRVLAAGSRTDVKASFVAQRLVYPDLLAAGVRIWEYQPTMLHAKTVLVDDALVSLGSINLNPLSLRDLEECTLIAYDHALAAQQQASFLADCVHAAEQTRPSD